MAGFGRKRVGCSRKRRDIPKAVTCLNYEQVCHTRIKFFNWAGRCRVRVKMWGKHGGGAEDVTGEPDWASLLRVLWLCVVGSGAAEALPVWGIIFVFEKAQAGKRNQTTLGRASKEVDLFFLWNFMIRIWTFVQSCQITFTRFIGQWRMRENRTFRDQFPSSWINSSRLIAECRSDATNIW